MNAKVNVKEAQMTKFVHNFTYPRQRRKQALHLAVEQDLPNPTRAFVWRGVIATSVLFWGAVFYLLTA